MGRLTSLGKVEKVVEKLGVAVVRLESSDIPSIGSRVFSQQRSEVGKVVDVIGKTSSPYAVVKLKGELPTGAILLYEVRGPGGKRSWTGWRMSGRRERKTAGRRREGRK